MKNKCKKRRREVSEFIYEYIYSPTLTAHTECKFPSEILCEYSSPGLFFGLPPDDQEEYYIGMTQDNGGHAVVFGGSGSGKSTGIVNPSMKTWNGGMFVFDLKGEHVPFYDNLWRNKVVDRPYILLDLRDNSEYSLDLFWWVKNDVETNVVDNIKEIVYAIVPEGGSKDKFWEESERSIFTAALLYYYWHGYSFIKAITAIANTTIFELCADLSTCDDNDVKKHLRNISHIKHETLALIGTSLTNHISVIFSSHVINKALSGSENGGKCFNWSDLEKYNIFLSVSEDKIEQWGGIINLIHSQLIHYLMRRQEKYTVEGANTVPILLLLDEVAQLGRVKILPQAIATLRSKNVSICLLVQSLAQLDKIYGEIDRRVILDNCSFKVILHASDPQTQQFLCDLIGKAKSLSSSMSKNYDSNINIIGYSAHISENRDYLIYPEELAYLNDVILLTPFGRYRIRKFQNYNIFHKLYFSSQFTCF